MLRNALIAGVDFHVCALGIEFSSPHGNETGCLVLATMRNVSYLIWPGVETRPHHISVKPAEHSLGEQQPYSLADSLCHLQYLPTPHGSVGHAASGSVSYFESHAVQSPLTFLELHATSPAIPSDRPDHVPCHQTIVRPPALKYTLSLSTSHFRWHVKFLSAGSSLSFGRAA